MSHSTITGPGTHLNSGTIQPDHDQGIAPLSPETRPVPPGRLTITRKADHGQQPQGDGFPPVLGAPQPYNADQLGITSDHFGNATTLVGPSMMEIMTVLHGTGTALKKGARESRIATREAEQETLQEAADKIKRAAIFSFAASVVGGVVKMAGGAMSLGGAAMAGKAAPQKMPDPAKLAQVKDQVKDQANALKQNTAQVNLPKAGMEEANRITARWDAGSRILQGGGDTIKEGLGYAAEKEQGKKADLEAQAAEIKYHIQDADRLVQNTQEMMRNVRARLSEIEQANHQTMQKINRI